MKYYETVSTLKFTWDQVAAGFWRRYPNPQSCHVLSEDVVDREVVNGCLHTKRIITKTNPIPKWGERFVLGSRTACVMEESVLDPVNKTLITYTRNISMRRVMFVEERCVYRLSQDNRGWTDCDKQAWINSSIFGFSRALKAFGMERFKKNAVKAVKGFEFVLNKMYNTPDSASDQPAILSNFSTDKLKEKAQQKAAKTLAKKGVVIT